MQKTILAIDIGNTSITAGLRAGERVTRVRRMPHKKGVDIRAFIEEVTGHHDISGAALASVVPKQTKRWLSAAAAVVSAEPLEIDHRCILGIGLDYPHPETIGADRLANSAGAFKRYGAPVVVADFGTALTFDVVSEAPAYIGGIIAPGLPLMFSYLAEKTALLPKLEPAAVKKGPVGRSTRDAMLIGARTGYRGMIEGILDELLIALGRKTTIVITGGHAEWVMKNWNREAVIDKNITLYGIAEIYRLKMEYEHAHR